MHKRWEEKGGGGSKTVKQLMGSRKVTSAVLGFIAATRAGQRAKRLENKTEKQEIERDKVWGLKRIGWKGKKKKKRTQREKVRIVREERRVKECKRV